MSVFKILFYFKSVLAYFFSLLVFPLSCISCGSQAYGVSLCKQCKFEFENNFAKREGRCKSCGVLLVSEKDLCLECRKGDETTNNTSNSKDIFKGEVLKHFDSIFPIHHYVLWKKELLFAWKIANNRSLTPIFSKTVYNVLNSMYCGIPVVPVPPRDGKIKKRGWDQIDELCLYLEKLYHIPIIKLLMRVSKEEQKKRSRKERLENIDKNYVFNKNATIIPEEVVLIDDIMTTGATLESCAKALNSAGVKKVHAVTIFYV